MPRRGVRAAAWAATADDYKAALAKAEAADKQAHALKNEWTTTAAALKAAKAAADAGKFDDAVKHAQAGRRTRQCFGRASQGAGEALARGRHPLTRCARSRSLIECAAARC